MSHNYFVSIQQRAGSSCCLERQEKAQGRMETFHFILCRVVPENTNIIMKFLLRRLRKKR